jgi:hypothetical protein
MAPTPSAQAVGGQQQRRCVFELQLGRPPAVLRAVAVAAQAGRAGFHQVQRQASTTLGRDDEGIRLVTHGHQAFCARQAIARGLGLAGQGPVAPAAFLPGQAQHRLARGQPGQPGRLRRQLAEQTPADQRLRQGFEHQAAAQLLHDHHGLHRPQAEAALVLGHGQAREAQLGEFGPGLARKAAAFHDGAAAFKAVALVHPAGHGLAQLLLVVGKIEIHGASFQPSRVWATMLRCTSLLPP